MQTSQDCLPALPLPDANNGPWPTFTISETDRRAISNGLLCFVKTEVTGKLTGHTFLSANLGPSIDEHATRIANVSNTNIESILRVQQRGMQSHIPIRSTQLNTTSSWKSASRSSVASSSTIVRSTGSTILPTQKSTSSVPAPKTQTAKSYLTKKDRVSSEGATNMSRTKSPSFNDDNISLSPLSGQQMSTSTTLPPTVSAMENAPKNVVISTTAIMVLILMLLIFVGATIYVLYLVKEFDQKIPTSTPVSSCQIVCLLERTPEEHVVWSVIPDSVRHSDNY